MRLQSDQELSRDARTVCQRQTDANNLEYMRSTFQTAMEKRALLDQIPDMRTDCSDVTFMQCEATPFPTLPVALDPVSSVANVPPELLDTSLPYTSYLGFCYLQ